MVYFRKKGWWFLMKERLFKKKEKPQKPKYNMWQNTRKIKQY